MTTNPYSTPAAVANSRYFGIQGGRPVRLAAPSDPPDLFEAAVAGAFRGFVQAPQFSCLGAKSAVGHDNYRVGVYDALGTENAAAGVAHDLWTFAQEMADVPDTEFHTFVTVYRGPAGLDEATFERLLWGHLRALNRLDAARYDWDPAVSPDPENPHFSFSFAGKAFFVVGLHPDSSREARRFPWPTLVFNIHAQFVRLKEDGKWDKFQQAIRGRETALQGSLNPNLADHGEATEARQYSGREVEPGWRVPFRPATADGPPARKPGGCPFGHGQGGKA